MNLGFGGKAKPKVGAKENSSKVSCQVGYATAMDVYIIICFFAVFAALVEFACINFIDTFIARFKAWEVEEKKRLEREEMERLEKVEEEEETKEIEESDNLAEVVLSKTREFYEDLVVIHPPNGGPPHAAYNTAEAADLQFMDQRCRLLSILSLYLPGCPPLLASLRWCPRCPPRTPASPRRTTASWTPRSRRRSWRSRSAARQTSSPGWLTRSSLASPEDSSGSTHLGGFSLETISRLNCFRIPQMTIYRDTLEVIAILVIRLLADT